MDYLTGKDYEEEFLKEKIKAGTKVFTVNEFANMSREERKEILALLKKNISSEVTSVLDIDKAKKTLPHLLEIAGFKDK
jgi:hypothetical protein